MINFKNKKVLLYIIIISLFGGLITGLIIQSIKLIKDINKKRRSHEKN